jgi:hypothetical protein
LRIAVGLIWLGSIAVFSAAAQDFQKSYDLRPEASVRIQTVSGNIKMLGYDGSRIVIEGMKSGRNCEGVEVVDRSAEDKIDISVRFQHNSNCDVSFQVRVPRGVRYSFDAIRSVSGTVQISDVSGRVVATSISGSVDIRNVNGVVSAEVTSGNVVATNITGVLNVNAVSGNVDVLLSKIEGSGDMKFASVSGNVTVKAPASLDASVSMSTLSGSLKTDFPIEIQQRRYVGESARGRLGEGARNIVIRSVSGRVSLLKI